MAHAALIASTQKKRRECNFDITESNICNRTQSARTFNPGKGCYISIQKNLLERGRCTSDVMLRDYLLRLNDMYAEDLEEIQLKADLAKLVASGRMDKNPMEQDILNSGARCMPKLVPGGKRSPGTLTSPGIMTSGDRKTVIDVAANAMIISDQKRGIMTKNMKNKNVSSSNLLEWGHRVSAVYSSRHGSLITKKLSKSPRITSGKKDTKKKELRVYRSSSAPPTTQLAFNDTDTETEDCSLRIPSTMNEESKTPDEEYAPTPPPTLPESSNSSLIIRMGSTLPKGIIDKKSASEKAVVLREKRKREMLSRRKEELALEKKLRFKPRYVHITHPDTPPSKLTTQASLSKKQTPKIRRSVRPKKSMTKAVKSVTSGFSQLNLKNLNSMETGLTNDDIRQFVHQSKLTREMLNINVQNNKLSMIFDERSLQCEKMLRREIQKHRPAKNPTFCIL